jgi:hypothetical protein
MKKFPVNCLMLIMMGCLYFPLQGQQTDKSNIRLERKAKSRSDFVPGLFQSWSHVGAVEVDSVKADKTTKVLDYYLSPSTTHIPIRTVWIEEIRSGIAAGLGRSFRHYRIVLHARGRLLEEYVPNTYREQGNLDTTRLTVPYMGKALVSRSSRAAYPGGLSGKHIALWPSHGFFYDQQLDRWQWQRARLWGTVEDIFPWSFTNAYLVPMLENAGATVLLPRERDIQVIEIIVDNDRNTGASQLVIKNGRHTWETSDQPGFMAVDTLFPGQNPFTMGTFLSYDAMTGDTASLTYIPDIPEDGDYAVYVSWARNDQCLSDVQYEVRYSGGKAIYEVNQCMGAGTWIYLGTFKFREGLSGLEGSVLIRSNMEQGTLTADAVRFGGGMGNVARRPEIKPGEDPGQYSWKTSGKPRWMEGSRYYLQYAGMPDSLVYNLNTGKNDYNDDYMSRGEWVNYLIGPARIQYNGKYGNGLGIPVDLALAFHTDAGVTRNDSVIGTLGIYSAVRNNGLFPNGQSKLASRDLTDLVQTQLVEDIRGLVNPRWTRRALWDREYSEAWRPIVPVMLLELLSHQNLADMRYGLDPRFKFIVARAIYKGMLRYLAVQDNREVVVEPLPPDHMAIEVLDDRNIKISWRPVADPFEKSAVPDGYRLYLKTEDQGFDTGSMVKDTFLVMTLAEWGTLYSFRVTAINKGGESLPGETLSVSLLAGDKKPVMIVNAFDRISGPAYFDRGDMAGIAWWKDEGVALGNDLSHTGNQYDFDRNSDWLHDDSQGWGASQADLETFPVAGNSFDFPIVHGRAFRDAGYSFVSVSDEVFEDPDFDASGYRAVDLIFGEERGTESFQRPLAMDFRVFTPSMMESVERYTKAGGDVFLSGAYIGTDMMENSDSVAIQFATQVLHYTWRTHHATNIGSVYVTDRAVDLFPEQVMFNTADHGILYKVESPDAIEPAGTGAFRIYRYTSGNCSAGIAYKGSYCTVALGFPFECILTPQQRAELITRVMNFFEN